MSKRAWSVALASAAFGLVLSAPAGAAGPWPGLANGVTDALGVTYSAKQHARATVVTAKQGSKVLRTVRLKGAFGVPAVTLNGEGGGLSFDGKLLVLAEPPNYQVLKQKSRFVLLRTSSLGVARTVTLKGDFGYDALSPDGRTLYLLEHRSLRGPEYAVRAYDVPTGRLLKRVIVDKRTPDEKMNGYPVARTSSAAGDWVYTLYNKTSGELFVHALNTKGRYAFCVDFAWAGGGDNDSVWQLRLSLDESNHVLTVAMPGGAPAAKVDTKTLNVIS
jgi:hypothetical protein